MTYSTLNYAMFTLQMKTTSNTVHRKYCTKVLHDC